MASSFLSCDICVNTSVVPVPLSYFFSNIPFFFFFFFFFLYSIIDCNEVENAVKDHMQWIQLSRVGPVFDGTANILYGD